MKAGPDEAFKRPTKTGRSACRLNHPRRLEGVADLFARRGHSDSIIEKVIGGNFHRVLKDIWGV